VHRDRRGGSSLLVERRGGLNERADTRRVFRGLISCPDKETQIPADPPSLFNLHCTNDCSRTSPPPPRHLGD